MPSLRQKLEKLFRERLREGMADLETLSNGHVCGHVISAEFERRDYEQRRKRIRRVLDEAVSREVLTQGELAKVSTLLTYTPAEWAIATAGVGDSD